jgi:hypothetical protein
MTSRLDTAEDLWSKLMSGDQPAQGPNVAARRQGRPPHQQKADERTRLVREMTDQRMANVARLRQARLNKDADDASQAALGVPTKKRRAGPAS